MTVWLVFVVGVQSECEIRVRIRVGLSQFSDETNVYWVQQYNITWRHGVSGDAEVGAHVETRHLRDVQHLRVRHFHCRGEIGPAIVYVKLILFNRRSKVY